MYIYQSSCAVTKLTLQHLNRNDVVILDVCFEGTVVAKQNLDVGEEPCILDSLLGESLESVRDVTLTP